MLTALCLRSDLSDQSRLDNRTRSITVIFTVCAQHDSGHYQTETCYVSAICSTVTISKKKEEHTPSDLRCLCRAHAALHQVSKRFRVSLTAISAQNAGRGKGRKTWAKRFVRPRRETKLPRSCAAKGFAQEKLHQDLHSLKPPAEAPSIKSQTAIPPTARVTTTRTPHFPD